MKKSEYITLRGLAWSFQRADYFKDRCVLSLAEDEAAMLERFIPEDPSYSFKVKIAGSYYKLTVPCKPAIEYVDSKFKFTFYREVLELVDFCVWTYLRRYYKFVKLPEPPENSFVESFRRRRTTNEQNQGAD